MNTPISPETAEMIKKEAEAYEDATRQKVPKEHHNVASFISYVAGAYIGYEAGASAYAPYKERCEELERWKQEAILVMSPLLDYGQSKEAEITLGASITRVILQRAKQFQEAKKALEEYVAAHKPLPWQNVSDNAKYKFYQRVNALLATWKEEKGGGHE